MSPTKHPDKHGGKAAPPKARVRGKSKTFAVGKLAKRIPKEARSEEPPVTREVRRRSKAKTGEAHSREADEPRFITPRIRIEAGAPPRHGAAAAKGKAESAARAVIRPAAKSIVGRGRYRFRSSVDEGEAMRRKGMRSITLWVPDTRNPEFLAEAVRQCRRANEADKADPAVKFFEELAEESLRDLDKRGL